MNREELYIRFFREMCGHKESLSLRGERVRERVNRTWQTN